MSQGAISYGFAGTYQPKKLLNCLFDKANTYFNHRYYRFDKKQYPDYLKKLIRDKVSLMDTLWNDSESKPLKRVPPKKSDPNYLSLASS
jgi:hypothetical protein